MNMPLICHHIFLGRMNHWVCHYHDEHRHQAWPPGSGHAWPRPHGQTTGPHRLVTLGLLRSRRCDDDECWRLPDVTVNCHRIRRLQADWQTGGAHLEALCCSCYCCCLQAGCHFSVITALASFELLESCSLSCPPLFVSFLGNISHG